jgi:hypothetical protein
MWVLPKTCPQVRCIMIGQDQRKGFISLPPKLKSFYEPMLTVKFRQPSHEFTFGVGITFISYPLVLTPLV